MDAERFINESENSRSLIIVIGYLRKYRNAIGYFDNITLPQLLPYNILIFYITTYRIYGIGRQESGEFGYGKHTTTKAYIRLDRYEKHLVGSTSSKVPISPACSCCTSNDGSTKSV